MPVTTTVCSWLSSPAVVVGTGVVDGQRPQL